MDELERTIAEWKKQYGEDNIYDLTPQIEGDDWAEFKNTRIICRKPARRDLSRLAKGLTGDSLTALQNLVYDCLLYPSREVIDRMLAVKPGLVISLGNALQDLAGIMTDFLPRKL